MLAELRDLAPCLNVAGYCPCIAGHRYPEQCNKDYDFHFILEGHGSVEIDGQRFRKRPGDLFLYPPAARLIEAADVDEPQVIAFAHFDSRWVGERPRVRPPPGRASPVIGLDLPLFTPGPAPGRIAELMHALIACRQEPVFGEAQLLRARGVICELLGYVLVRAEDRSAGVGRDRERMRAVVEQMRERLSEPLRLDGLAREVGLSPSYFSECFRAGIGEAPMAYLLGLRIERAQELLRSTRLPVGAIAERCGFASQHYFSRAFRKRVGRSPRQYRDDGGFF